jgi:hypothetical protein
MQSGLPSLQILPETIQETGIAGAFKRRKNITQNELDERTNINGGRGT